MKNSANTIAPATTLKGNCGILLFFFYSENGTAAPGVRDEKKGRWYTDEEERVLGMWSNPSIHVPVHTAACSSVHSAPPYTSCETVKTACCPLPPHTAPKYLSLLGCWLSASLMHVLFL